MENNFNKNKSLTEIYQEYISPLIPQSVTNVLWNLFRGIEVSFGYLESYLKVSKREQNILTAQEVSSLRNIASGNGFEPQLKLPSRGKILLNPNGSLFAKNGTTLFIPAYGKFTEKNTGLEYFVDTNNITKLSNQPTLISIKQGVIESRTYQIQTDEKLQKYYINSSDVADKSVTIIDASTKEQYELVESFYDNVNLNNNKQFMIRFSTKPTSPIVIYIKGTKLNQTLNISYILTQGANGNVLGESEFICDSLMDYKGNNISYNDDDMVISNYDGFTLGSDGSDLNTLKSAIGFNHGINMLFDVVSYRNFINKFSTILLQNIYVDKENKAIKHIFMGRKNVIIGINKQAKDKYIEVIDNRLFELTRDELTELESIINENEFTLSSSNFNDLDVTKYAIQIEFKTVDDLYEYGSDLELNIYNKFSEFLYIENKKLDFEKFISDYCDANKISLEYMLFDNKSTGNLSSVIIDSDFTLPILKGDFNIYDINNNAYRLNDNINYVVKT